MIVPRLGAEHFKTYQILAPIPTHFRPASCREVECKAFTNGWRTTVLPDSPQARYIRSRSGRRFVEAPNENGDGTVVFTFPAGQQCFRAADHRVSLEREPVYVMRGGDFRGNPRGEASQQMRPADWVDNFAEHQSTIANALERG